MKIAVIYASKYGATRRYAEWIAARLGATLLERTAVKPAQLDEYDLVVYGGGLYAGGIAGVDLVTKHPCKRLVLFTVGLGTPATSDYTGILEKNLPQAMRESTPVFHLHGGIDYGRLSTVHRAMMGVMKRIISKKPESERSADDRELLATYGGAVDFTDPANIEPLAEYVESLSR